MKKYIIIAGIVILFSGAFVSVTYAAPTTIGDLMNVIQKVVAKFELEIAKINNNLQAQVIHVTMQDQDCQTGRVSSTVTGWCPDGVQSDFSITNNNFIPGNSVITAQASSPIDAGVIKVDNCTFRAVTGVFSPTPLIRLVCEFAPNDGSTLHYVIVNHS